MKAMILAAGKGTRMRPLTNNCPKPLLNVAGKPLIVHHIEQLVKLGIREIIINHAYLGYMIEEALGDGRKFGCHLKYSAEQDALETGGGILKALPLLVDDEDHNAPFLLINGDVWLDWSAIHLPDKIEGLCHLWLVKNPKHNLDGDFILTKANQVLDKHQQQLQLEKDENLAAPLSEGLTENVNPSLTYTGMSLIKPELFDQCEPGAFPLAPLLRQAMSQHLSTGELYQGVWVDVGTPERLQFVEDLIKPKSCVQ